MPLLFFSEVLGELHQFLKVGFDGATASIIVVDDLLKALGELSATPVPGEHLRNLLFKKCPKVRDLDVLVSGFLELLFQLVEVHLAGPSQTLPFF